MGARNPEEALQLGGPVEEVAELILGEFSDDEWRQLVAEQNVLIIESLQELIQLMSAPQEEQPTRTGSQRPLPQVVGRAFKEPVNDADSDLLDDDVEVEQAGVLRTTVSLSGNTTFDAVITQQGDSQEMTFNDGTALGADELYVFDLAAVPRLSYNFQVGAATDVNYLAVHFIRAWG